MSREVLSTTFQNLLKELQHAHDMLITEKSSVSVPTSLEDAFYVLNRELRKYLAENQ